MKRTLKKLTAVFIAAAMTVTCLPQAVIAADLSREAGTLAEETDQEFKYTELEDGTVAITQYLGSSEKIIIPPEIDGKKVTAIMDLYGNSSMVEVTIPETVEKIESHVFTHRFYLTAIHVDENNKYYKDIDGVLFSKDEKTILAFPSGRSETYTIPDSVTTIGEWAFSGNDMLIDITIPESVTTINFDAFADCFDLESVIIPDSVTTIGEGAFQNSNLKSIILPESVTEMGTGIFSYCDDIVVGVYEGSAAETYVKEGSIKYVLVKDFLDEKSGIKITAGVPADAQFAVEQTEKTDTYVSYNMTFTRSGEEISPDGNVILRIPVPESFSGKEMYVYCKGADGMMKTMYTFVSKDCFVFSADCFGEFFISTEKFPADFEYSELDDGTLMITKYAGRESEVVVPAEINGKKVTVIGESVFSNCPSLTKITVSDGITTINSAFTYCDSLTEVYLPKSVTSMSGSAFMSSPKLTAIHVDENNENYKDIDGVLFTKDEKTICQFPSGKAGAYVIPDGVTEMSSIYTFYKCSLLTEITIPDSMTKLYDSPFYWCKQLTAIHVDKNNENYKDIDGVLLTKDGKTLVQVPNGKSGAYVVPDGVTTIKRTAFATCELITAVTIPDGVTTIGSSAFENCYSLTEITFPDSLTTIESYAFNGCSFTEVTIPQSVTTLGENPFMFCHELTAIHVDEKNANYKDIDGVLFTKDEKTIVIVPAGTTGAYTIPDGVTTIDSNALYTDNLITEVTIPDSVTSIGEWAFRNCISLKSVIVPKSVTEIGEYAFLTSSYNFVLLCYADSYAETYAKENSVRYALANRFNDEETGIEMIAGISADAQLNVEQTENEDTIVSYNITFTQNGEEVKPEGGVWIRVPAPEGWSIDKVYVCGKDNNGRFTEINAVISDGWITFTAYSLGQFIISSEEIDTSIQDYKYSELADGTLCIDKYLGQDTEVTIPSKIGGKVVTMIGRQAFAWNSYITKVSVPENVTSIGDSAFNVCTSLTEVNLPDSLTTIGSSAFVRCSSLTTIDFPDGLTTIGEWAFANCSLTEIVLPDSVTDIGQGAFMGCSFLKNATLPKNITSIEYGLFKNCSVLNAIEIPDNVKSIENSAFMSCINLEKADFPDSLEKIDERAFLDCCALAEVKLPATLKTIGNLAFKDCTSLTTADLSDGLTTIGNYAFAHTSLAKINLPDSVTDIGQYAFSECLDLENITLPANITSIEYGTFMNCSALTAIEIPDNVKRIESSAFIYCTNLEKADFPDSLEKIDERAFLDCSSLTEIKLPSTLTTIGRYAFADCSSLTTAELSDGLTTIGEYAFAWCSSLEEIDLPDSVAEIGERAFMSSSLKNVTLPANVTSIEYGTFMNCSSLTEVEIPDNVKSIGEGSFLFCKALEKATISPYVETISDNSFLRNEWTGSPDLTFYGYTNSPAEAYANKFEIPFVALGIFLDSDSDVSITADDGVVPDDTKLDVEQTDKTDTSVSYNITLTKDEKEIQPEGEVTVRIPVPAGWDVDEIHVYHKDAGGTMTEMNVVVSDGYIIFTTDHFSEYVVSSTKIAATIKGDTDGDGQVTELDSVALARYLANWDVTIDETAADLDGDGEVGETDSVILARRLAGWNV